LSRWWSDVASTESRTESLGDVAQQVLSDSCGLMDSRGAWVLTGGVDDTPEVYLDLSPENGSAV
jgi:glucose-6-phosphate dehydrogenase assembly protein OpcA